MRLKQYNTQYGTLIKLIIYMYTVVKDQLHIKESYAD